MTYASEAPGPRKVYVDAVAVSRAYGVPPPTVRTWAARGLIQRHGTDAKGRTLYDLDEVVDHMARAKWKARVLDAPG